MRSTTFSLTASSAVTETLSRTAFSAQSAFRPRAAATLRANAAVSFSTFFAMSLPASSSTSRPPPVTGWAAPMLEVGCIAATSAASVRNTPAEPARAPAGPTHTSVGTSLASIALHDVARRVEQAARRVERDGHRGEPRPAARRERRLEVLRGAAGDRPLDLDAASTRGGAACAAAGAVGGARPAAPAAATATASATRAPARAPRARGRPAPLTAMSPPRRSCPSSLMTSCRSSHAFFFSSGLRRR